MKQHIRLVLVTIILFSIFAGAQRLTTTQPTVVCDTTTLTRCATVTAANAVKMDGSAVTQPVSGTVTANAGSGTFGVSGTITANQGGSWTNAATQSGTWTVQPGNTANSTPWLVTANAGTGTFTVGVAQNSATSGQIGPLVQCATVSAAPTYTNATTNPCTTSTSGELYVSTAHMTASGPQLAANSDSVVSAVNSFKRYISTGTSTDESEVKGAAGTLVSISARNAHATTNAFLKCTNATAASTTPGMTAVFYEMIVPAGGGFVDTNINAAFSTALTCYITSDKADSGTTAVAANDVSYNLRYW